MQSKIKSLIRNSLKSLNIEADDILVEHPAELALGDYSTNIAMILAKNLKSNPKDLAQKIAEEINKKLLTEIDRIEVVGGFINFHLNKYFFKDSIKKILDDKKFGVNDHFAHKKIMIEYTDPNPFKPFHIGHLMTNAIGESIARIVERSGAKVLRINYQGDVGLHVAKAIYILLKDKKVIKKDALVAEASFTIGEAYGKGSEAYEKDPKAKSEIDEINKKIYDKSDAQINEIYDWGFKMTMEAFEEIYKILGTKFDLYFLESDMAPFGEKIVREHLKKVFSESDGAIVFKGEDYDSKLHTRVFVTSAGLSTYETKELGLTEAKFEEAKDLDLSIVITANEQADYMRVVAKAISIIHPEYEKKMRHITHGMMRFADGKMSSRTGNVITGESLMQDVRAFILQKIKDRDFKVEEKEKVASDVAVSAIKYGILKQSTNGNIVFDLKQATSFEGDSGPYLQYSYARARSVLVRAEQENIFPNFDNLPEGVTEVEKLLYRFPEIILRAVEEFEPHYVANFLVEVARAFNTFYGSTQIINKNDLATPYRLALNEAFSKVMKDGLFLLGIEAPEKM